MPKVNPYRDGVEKMADSLKSRASTPSMGVPEPAAKPPADSKAIAKDTSPDYVVETSTLKERAQKLLDSGQFSGEDSEFLEKVIAES